MATLSELVIGAAIAATFGAAGWGAKTVYERRQEERKELRSSQEAARLLTRRLLEELSNNWRALDEAPGWGIPEGVTNTVFLEKLAEGPDRFREDVWQEVRKAYETIEEARRRISSDEALTPLADHSIAIDASRYACGQAILALGGQVPASLEERYKQAIAEAPRLILQSRKAFARMKDAERQLEEELATYVEGPVIRALREDIRQALEAGIPTHEVSRLIEARLPADASSETIDTIDDLILKIAATLEPGPSGPPSDT